MKKKMTSYLALLLCGFVSVLVIEQTPAKPGSAKVPALIEASASGDLEAVKAQLAAKADINATDPRTLQTALMKAGENKHLTIALLLLQHNPDLSLRDAAEKTALHYAVIGGNPKLIDELLKKGADATATDLGGNGMIALAVKSKHRELIPFLAQAKANVNQADDLGMTPLIWAVLHNDLRSIKVLKKLGADHRARTEMGLDALQLAKSKKLPDIVAYLEKL